MAKNSMFVGKALSPEEATGLSNIAAICQEILQSQGNGGAPEAQEPEGDEGQAQMSQYDNPKDPANEGGGGEPDGDEEDPKKKAFEVAKKNYMMAKKALETTPPDASDADMDPEKIQDEIETDETKRAMAIAKALLGLSKPQAVKKSKDPVLTAIEGMAQVLKVQAERQDVLAQSLGGLMSGMGVMKQLETVQKAAEKPAYKPVSTGADAEALLSYIAKGLGQQNPQAVQKSQSEQVADESLSIVESLFRR
jgi:hypothetical protein